MEDEDYMSDTFLNECAKTDVRPGLLYTNKLRREHEQYKKKKESNVRSFNELAEEKREEGLKQALPETNKGFLMLKKMGYSPGQGVGKSTVGSSDPIQIAVKKNNFGLGLSKKITEKINASLQSTEDYRASLKKRQEINELKTDYSKIRRICENMDKIDGLTKPTEKWFWSENQTNSSDESSTEESSDNEDDKKDILTLDEMQERVDCIAKYLKEKYYYCLWCSIKFDDEKDMTESCPGTSRKLHESDIS